MGRNLAYQLIINATVLAIHEPSPVLGTVFRELERQLQTAPPLGPPSQNLQSDLISQTSKPSRMEDLLRAAQPIIRGHQN